MNPKELKKLAKACRDAGIKHFKNAEIEFTLADEAPQSPYKRKQASNSSTSGDTIETSELSPDQLLEWSVGGGVPFTVEGKDS